MEKARRTVLSRPKCPDAQTPSSSLCSILVSWQGEGCVRSARETNLLVQISTSPLETHPPLRSFTSEAVPTIVEDSIRIIERTAEVCGMFVGCAGSVSLLEGSPAATIFTLAMIAARRPFAISLIARNVTGCATVLAPCRCTLSANPLRSRLTCTCR